MSWSPRAWRASASPHDERLLLADLLRLGHPAELRAFGFSMLPSLPPGARLRITPPPFQPPLAPGDLLLTLQDERLRLHRLVAIPAPGRYITKGDAALRADPPCDDACLLGRASHRDGQRIAPAARRPLLRAFACASGAGARALALGARLARRAGLWPARQMTRPATSNPAP